MCEGRQPGDARLREVAGGIFAYVQPDGGWCLNNAGVIVSDGECALVDTAATETRARALRRVVRSVAPDPPRLVINTHSHGDHTFGNFVFPEAVVIGQERARTEMTEVGLHLTSLWPEVAWGELRLVVPQVVFDRQLTLHIGTLRAELLHPGIAHTAGDAAVWLPRERVLFTGDLAMSGVSPFVPMGSVAGSLAALDALRALEPRVVVPGHGPVGGPEILDDTMAYLRLVQRLAEDGLAAGLGPAAIAERADLGRFARWLDAERLVPNLHRARAEASGAEPGSPLDMNVLFADMTAFHGGVPACHA
ncbi:MBL fold metallo-hydrolase [Streptomyces platensis]|uniref:MBL fold metallo-hydrolase n=1 Tax=Streptomyces platensis TaxID=58346 RepID=UPI0038677B01|nr:MBL fold metallo-hydrolase [Streptomyces platensis]